MIKAVIFDLDQTLVDFVRMKKASCDIAMHSMIDAGLKISHEEGMKTLFELYKVYGMEYQTIFQEFLNRTMGGVDNRILAQGILAYRKVRNAFLIPYPGVTKTLIELKAKGIKLAIVSDAPRLKAWMRLCALGLDDFFDVVITHDDTGMHKPSELPFKAALEKLQLKPEDCIMIGDHPDRDVKGARALGIKTVLAKYGCIFESQEKADHEINKIEELLSLIQ